MSRRAVLELAELVLVTVALAAALGLLAHAANVGRTQWAAAVFAGAITALALLLPTVFVLLLRAAWHSGPGAWQAVHGRVRDWRQWRGIKRADTPPVRDTMAVRPRTVAHTGRHR